MPDHPELVEARATVRATGRRAGIIRSQLRVTIHPPRQPEQHVIYSRTGRWLHGSRWLPLDGRPTGLGPFLAWCDRIEGREVKR